MADGQGIPGAPLPASMQPPKPPVDYSQYYTTPASGPVQSHGASGSWDTPTIEAQPATDWSGSAPAADYISKHIANMVSLLPEEGKDPVMDNIRGGLQTLSSWLPQQHPEVPKTPENPEGVIYESTLPEMPGATIGERIGALEGAQTIKSAEPKYVYRGAPIEEEGISGARYDQASFSPKEAQSYAATQGGKISRLDLNRLPKDSYEISGGVGTPNLVRFTKPVPPELTEELPLSTGHKATAYRNAGNEHGVQYRGIQEPIEGKHPGVIVFQDPQSGTSVGIRADEWSPDKLKEHVTAARERMKIKPIQKGEQAGIPIQSANP
jgi:hypothetical protein